MWTVISVSFVIVAAVLGITEILRRFWLYLMRPKGTPAAIMVIKLRDDIAVQQLRYALEFLSWEKNGEFSAIAVSATELSKKTSEDIKKIINGREDVIFLEDLKTS